VARSLVGARCDRRGADLPGLSHPGLGAIGLGTLTGRLDLVMLPLLVGFVGLAVYRYGGPCRRKP
jgi:hypothetical protein